MRSSYKESMKRYYNQEAELRDGRSVKPDWKARVRSDFLAAMRRENKRTLLELGAGAGHDSQFFRDHGVSVTAVDFSAAMVAKCREKGIEAYELDFYEIPSLNRRFDCAYAMNALLHVPQSDFAHVLAGIHAVLNGGGLFFMGLYGGDDTESEFVKSEVSDAPRFFAFHSEAYLRKSVKAWFDMLQFESFDIGTGRDIFHAILMQKREGRAAAGEGGQAR